MIQWMRPEGDAPRTAARPMVSIAAAVLVLAGAAACSERGGAGSGQDSSVADELSGDSGGEPEVADAQGSPDGALADAPDTSEVSVTPDAADTGELGDTADAPGEADALEAHDAISDGEVGLASPLEAPVATELSGRDWSRVGVVRAIYLTPSDRPFAVGLRERLHAWAVMAREFMRDEMKRWGHTNEDGEGRTFELELADDGLWDVVFMVSANPASHFHARPNAPDAPGEALAEIFQRLPPEAHRDAIVVYFYDTHEVDGRAVIHTGQGGSAAPWQGEHAGYALIGAHVLGVGFDTVSVAAFAEGAGQRELFEDLADSGFDDWDGHGVWRGLSRGEWASVFVGAAIHELGHAFGLEHVFSDEDGDEVENNLMGNGFRRFGGRFTTELPQPPTLLGPVSAEHLARHPWIR